MYQARPRRRGRRPGFEGLEDRRLLAVTITNIPLGSSSTQINGVTAYPDGNIWLAATNPAELVVFHPPNNEVLAFPLDFTGSAPQGIAVGQDGDLYFTDSGTNSIGVFSPATMKSFEVPIPTKASGPTSIAVAPNGTIWFTETAVSQIGEYNPATQTITEFPLAAINLAPNYIQLGPDGNLWFEQFGAFDAINPTTHAMISIPATQADASVGGFTFIPNGNIEYVASASGQFAAAQLVPSTGNITISPPSATGPTPRQLVLGADGNVYFAMTPASVGTTVGEINLATGKITVYSGGVNTGSETSIVSAPGGLLYVGAVGVLGQATIVPPTQSAISGQVLVFVPPSGAGAPIAGRTVFVDLNGDGTLDPGDPFAVTDTNGNYTIPDVPIGSFNIRVVPFPGDFTSSTPITTAGGNVEQNVDVLIQPTSAQLPLALLSNPFGVDNPNLATAEVTGLYGIILDRAPDPSGLAHFVSYLQGGGSVSTVATAMLNSTEYETDLISSYYETYLGRAGSATEVAGWVALMQQGATANKISFLFLTSDEFNALTPTPASFINAVFIDLLGRQPSASELSSWVGYVEGTSRYATVFFMINSPEAGIRVAQGLYAQFWATPIDLGGEAAVVTALNGGMTPSQVAAQFAAAPQYVARAQDATL